MEGQRGLPGGTRLQKVTIYGVIVVISIGLRRARRWGRCFEFIIWCGKSQRWDQLLWENFSLYTANISKSFSLAGHCKSLYRIPILKILAVLPVLYLLIFDKLRAFINVCITQNYSVTL